MEDREIIENEKNDECEIVKEVREIRHKISAQFDHDVGSVGRALSRITGTNATVRQI